MSRKQAPIAQWKRRKIREKLQREIPEARINAYAELLKQGYSRFYAGSLAGLTKSEVTNISYIPKIKKILEREKEKQIIARRFEYQTRRSIKAAIDIPAPKPFKPKPNKEVIPKDPIELLPVYSPVRMRLVKKQESK